VAYEADSGRREKTWIKVVHSLAVGPIEAFTMIQSFRRNSMNFDLAREHSYWMNQIMGVYPVVWEVKVGTSIWWEDTHMELLSP
jgi:hypothetical protein